MNDVRFYVWGTGPASDRAIREGEDTAGAIAYAASLGYSVDAEWDWAAEVTLPGPLESAEAAMDAATRYDRAVAGWVAVEEG